MHSTVTVETERGIAKRTITSTETEVRRLLFSNEM